MMGTDRGRGDKGDETHRDDAPALGAIGLEAEFALVVDGMPTKVETLFRDPRDFIACAMVHRAGTSFHLPNGGAVYFDTGVIEVATPLVELDRASAARASRSLWEAIRLVRDGLSDWERRTGRRVALVGFSTHYNVSLDLQPATGQRLDDLARLLAYVLPPPVMALATNRASTGVGVRPRRTRLEVTADFTPDAPLLIATAGLVAGIVRAVMRWPAFDFEMLAVHRLPVIQGFRPMPHTTRQGWLARFDCYPENPFTAGLDAPIWPVRGGVSGRSTSTVSLRQIARQIFERFRWSIARASDPITMRLIAAVLSGRATSLLDLPVRPASYEDVGRSGAVAGAFAPAVSRSRYERVLMRALSGAPLRMGRDLLTPLGTRGWSHVVFRRERDRAREVWSLDALLPHLERWEASGDR